MMNALTTLPDATTSLEELAQWEAYLEEQRHAPYTGGFDFRPYWRYDDETGSLWDEPVPRDVLPIPSEFDARLRYHYCFTDTLATKLKDGCLYPFREIEMPEITSVVWSSTDPLWESDCAVAISLGLGNEQSKDRFSMPGGVLEAARIGLKPSVTPYHWTEYWEWAGVPEPEVALHGAYDHPGLMNSENWFVTPLEIPSLQWSSVEVWDTLALKWIPLHRSSNRMERELITLLPHHLRGPHPEDASFNRLCAAARQSPWIPGRTQSEDGFVWNAVEFGDDEDPYLSFMEYQGKIRNVRRRWFQADLLARAGVAVAPLRRGQGRIAPDAAAWATTRLSTVDKYWLVDYPGDPYGIVLGPRSGGLFALKLEGVFCNDAFMRDGESTAFMLVIHDEAQGDWHTLALFVPPEGSRIVPGVVAEHDRGRVTVITSGLVHGPGTDGRRLIMRRPGPLVPAKASDGLMARLQIKRNDQN